MRILVTGGSGFIGRHVVREALARGHEVVVMDIRRPEQEVPFVRADILAPPSLPPGEAVVHLAAVSDAREARRDPIRCWEVNVLGTLRILEAASEAGYGYFLHASTEWVYAGSGADFVDEGTPISALGIEDPYISSKIASETAVSSISTELGMKYLIVRIGNPFGPGEREGMLHREVIRRILAGESIELHGGGEQARQFLHVSDLARGMILAIEMGIEGILNLTGSRPVKVKEVVSLVAELLGREPKTTVVPGERAYSGKVVSIERARKELGWEPLPYVEALRRYLSELGLLGGYRPRKTSA